MTSPPPPPEASMSGSTPPPPPVGAKRFDPTDIEGPEPRPAAPRRYDLDALRGFAMLLGIALHAALPFVPYWADGDPGGGFLFGLFEFIHGFRMPLFFILSGYFTTMLWRRRGLRSLVDHRARRIGLPFLASVAVVLPLLLAGLVVGYAIAGADLEAAIIEDAYEDPADRDAVDDSPPAEIGGDGAGENDEPQLTIGHLWFLWFLLLMVAGFAAVARVVGWLAKRRDWERPVPQGIVTVALLAVPFLAVPPLRAMSGAVFGPDTSETIIPNGYVLLFYLCFFSFGALAYDRHTQAGQPLIDAVGRWWPAQLGVGSLLLFPAGLALMESNQWAAAALQVAFAWSISFGLLGLFRRFLSGKNFHVRWLSDASYWMYLMHLPLVFVFQGIAAAIGLPPLIAFVFICVATVPLLLASYRSWVRYTFVGTLLNGDRTREADAAARSSTSSDGSTT